VGIDPAAKASAEHDRTSETGIVVAGLGEDGRGYVLDDLSCRLSPQGWAAKARALSDLFPRMVKPVPDVAWEDERGGGGGGWLL
jgi:phage terminase large subunit-like protein